MTHLKKMTLIDLPTFPKGVISLSLPTVAASLQDSLDVAIIDLNLTDFSKTELGRAIQDSDLYGLKVSAQNLPHAIEVTEYIRDRYPDSLVVWGGDYSTLRPDVCEQYADAIVSGAFEPVAEEFIRDYRENRVRGRYVSPKEWEPSSAFTPALSLVSNKNAYFRFLGEPLETSRGCPHGCSFCLVHHMQPSYAIRPIEAIQKDLKENKREFINVVDYNAGTARNHIMRVAEEIGQTRALGWTVEMCIESLDDDELLQCLANNRCSIVYVGLESIHDNSLNAVAKRQNVVGNYQRIIRKVQSYGVQVAAGVIIGLPGWNHKTLSEVCDVLAKWNVIYAKFTFLTFNPGTRVKHSMRRKGVYVKTDDRFFDGNHLTFVPEGVAKDAIYHEIDGHICGFYSWRSLLCRSKHLSGNLSKRFEFMLFSYCYGNAYREWSRTDVLNEEDGNIRRLQNKRFRKSMVVSVAELVLHVVRTLIFRKARAGLVLPSGYT